MREHFDDFNKIKADIRLEQTPLRMTYATQEISKIWKNYHILDDKIIIRLQFGTINFWPFNGWFQGQKPYGYVRGRGIKNLIKELSRLISI